MHITDAPVELVAHCLPIASAPSIAGQPGQYDAADLTSLVRFLTERGEFETYDPWMRAGMALRLSMGDDGFNVWRLTFDDTVTDDVAESKWRSFATEAKSGAFTVASLMKRGHELGWRGTVRKSASIMFDAVAATTDTVARGRSLIGGGAQWQPAAPEYGEIEIAERFVGTYGSQLRYVTARGAWVRWTGKRWINDETDYVVDLARQHCRAESALCAATPGHTTGQARAVSSDKTVKAVLRLAQVDQRVSSKASDWDQDAMLLGTPDGIVDLRTGTLREARPDDYVTKSTAVSPAGDCPTWLTFLRYATRGDEAKQAYLQRLAGYALTGSTREQSLYFAYGPGRTGKGTFMHAIASILRDYHVTTAIETLTESRSDRHPAEVAALQGARLVTCSETERGRHWAEGRIKQFTGGDEVSARFMNKNFFTFTPTFKLIISGNYKPHLRADSAMRRRFHLIPFDAVVSERDQDPLLGSKLEREWPGILGWMIAGALEWQRCGLSPPDAVVRATEEYMNDEAEDVTAHWLTERCTQENNLETAHDVLYRSYRFYAEQAGERPMTSTVFGKELVRLGFRKRRTNAGRLVTGLALREPPIPPVPGQHAMSPVQMTGEAL